MQGAKPIFVERGPYIYDDHMTKVVNRIDEELDEIEYNIIRSFRFNGEKSDPLSDKDQITIMNVAYLGAINTIATVAPSFLPDVGNDLYKLFPLFKNIFVKGKVKDILFDGLSLNCNKKKYPELAMICNVLKTKKPPIMRDTDREGIYKYSYLAKLNGTVQGPFTANRGVRNLSLLGELTSIEGKRNRKMWEVDECNQVSGSDSITWSPMDFRKPRLYPYVLDACRNVFISYEEDIIVSGINGWKYQFTEDLWDYVNMECYCPRDDQNNIQCLPKGLQDISKCQEAPVIMSEPHFLNADPIVLAESVGLTPNKKMHSTYLIVDPVTGVPVAGQKRLQLNMRLIKMSEVDYLNNVSDTYFPLLWMDQGGVANIQQLSVSHQAHRTLHLLKFLQALPIFIGLYILSAAFFLL
ncbi:sensory neuron membrane protein 2-like [Prorops nasuta]|uniref:sensory neuron membrane protein 2-like n=1 Tax=Prorops nasuta TaxID=863751 RepID=UPI0034CE9026